MATELSEHELQQQLSELRRQHRELDRLIALLADAVACDQLSLRRMKKRKLQLKDRIAYLEDELIPDLDA